MGKCVRFECVLVLGLEMCVCVVVCVGTRRRPYSPHSPFRQDAARAALTRVSNQKNYRKRGSTESWEDHNRVGCPKLLSLWLCSIFLLTSSYVFLSSSPLLFFLKSL